MNLPKIDYSITSPPYWNILHRSTGNFKERREKNNYDTKYSEEHADLGNIEDYNQFIEEIFKIYEQIYSILKDKGYITIIVKNVKKQGKLYPLAWDLAERLGKLYVLKDEKIWIQDKVRLAPYGYPYGWVSNIIHHYCLILQKDDHRS
jgi:DNA modification methylase